MDDYCDGYAFLEELRRNNPGEKGSFQDYSRYLEKKARERGIPLNGQFELTPLCNFRCGMCYVRLSEGQMCRPLLTPAQWNGLIDQACEAGMLSATLSGGECLTYPGFREVYEHLQGLGCEVEVFTNGSLLDGEWIAYFQRHSPAGIYITLYGDSEDAYERVTGQRAFERVLGNIRAVRDTELPLRINVTPNRFLGEDVFGTIRLAKELCPSVSINTQLSAPREETGRADWDIELDDDFYIRLLKYRRELDGVNIQPCPEDRLPPEGGPERNGVLTGLRCGGGRSGFNVDWKGTMSPCNALEMVRSYPFETGFARAWKQIHEEAERWPRASACEGCAYESVCEHCAGRILRYAKAGEWPRSLCAKTKQFVRQGVYQVADCE